MVDEARSNGVVVVDLVVFVVVGGGIDRYAESTRAKVRRAELGGDTSSLSPPADSVAFIHGLERLPGRYFESASAGRYVRKKV